MRLWDLASCRAGDKGNLTTLSLFPHREEDFAFLESRVTGEWVAAEMKSFFPGGVTRYLLPNVSALHYVCVRDPSHSVTVSLELDAHGKTLSYALLNLEVETL